MMVMKKTKQARAYNFLKIAAFHMHMLLFAMIPEEEARCGSLTFLLMVQVRRLKNNVGSGFSLTHKHMPFKVVKAKTKSRKGGGGLDRQYVLHQ